ncbi:MAG TPA: hypothetical protein VMG30_18240 [Acidobacteriota bacterium]|nr:hypothetical protein [Acidobacteriota bacterium]
MKKSLLVILLLPVFACAQSAFDGTWRFEFPRPKPHRVLLRGDILRIPDLKINVKADGTDQPAQGLQSYDTIAAKVVDDKTVQMTYKKNGKIVASQKDTVSADGKMLTREITYPDPGNQPDTPKFTFIRAAAGASGSHAISGTWIQQIPTTYTIRYKGSPEGLTMLTPTGEPASDAKFDGKDYPVKSGMAGRTISLTRVNDTSIDQTTKINGRIVQVDHLTVSADGKTLTIRSEVKETGGTFTQTGTRQ